MKLKKKFIKDTRKVTEDEYLLSKLEFATSKYFIAEEKGIKRFVDFEEVRNIVSSLKEEVLENFEFYFNRFTEKFKEQGGNIYIASNAEDAKTKILEILKKYNTKTVVKSKSMATEEIELNKALESHNIEVYETDLGEFIVQIANQRPYHIISPALHLSKKDVIRLYASKFGTPQNITVEKITAFTRDYLRTKFLEADAGITGANFLLSDIGGITLTENEGNAILSAIYPQVRIIIAGIEKLIPSVEDISLLWQTISFRGTGQTITSFNSIILPDTSTYLIILDNGRFNILKDRFDRQIFKCLRCGSCFYYCPVYRNIGGHSYNTVYGGPMGSILSSLLYGLEEYGHLIFACTLCNKCTEVCPVKIPLTEMILDLRRRYVEEKHTSFIDRVTMKVFSILGSKRFVFNIPSKIKNLSLPVLRRIWGKRDFPRFQKNFLRSKK